MSLEVIKTQIRSFLKSKEPEVLAIRGDWGVGKTFTWETILKEAQEEKLNGDPKSIGLSFYSYVSLFGITTLQDLRTEISFNKLNTLDLKHAEGVTKFQKSSGKYLPKIISQALKYTGINAGTLVDTMFASMSNSMLKNMIICIDDFERSTIEEREALGFINDLKCKRNCKIVLLLNDNKTKEFKNYREKVIDYDIKFSLSPEEATTLIFGDDVKDDFYEVIIENCNKIETNNLRVIKKIKDLVDDAAKNHNLSQYNINLRHQFIKSAVLAAYCFYEHHENAPPLIYIRNNDLRTSHAVKRIIGNPNLDETRSDKDEKDSEIFGKYELFLNNYEFSSFDRFDDVIFNSVESGFIDREKFEVWARRRNFELENFEARNDVNKIMQRFKNSIMTDQEVEREAKELERTCLKLMSSMSKTDLNNVYDLLFALDMHDSKNRILESYITTNSMKNSAFHTSMRRELRDLDWNKELKTKLDEIRKERAKTPTPNEVIDTLSKTNRRPRDLQIEVIDGLTEEDVSKIINGLDYENFDRTIALLINLGKLEPRLAHISKKSLKVLNEHAAKSKQAKYIINGKFGDLLKAP